MALLQSIGAGALEFEPAVSLYRYESQLLRTKVLVQDRTSNHTHRAVATALFSLVRVEWCINYCWEYYIPFNNQENTVGTMNVCITHCPPGYSLKSEFRGSNTQYYSCQCNSASNTAILTCDNERVLFLVSHATQYMAHMHTAIIIIISIKEHTIYTL